ncbi:MAG: ABC transporter ATP-binding protein/permease [Saccharofermentans sp.]|nr:ABC transporter ATP-binding protein/permease [Saccharofermentans sp.]
MIRKILKSLRQYKKDSLLSLLFVIGEVILEVLIPSITASMVNYIQNEGADMNQILKSGALIALAAIASLLCGTLAGNFSARASSGFAGNLRSDIFKKVQQFSFSNIDKFSTSSLVTRMTTDITTVQNAYMMAIRIAVRAPSMLIFAIVMAYVSGGSLATTFVIVVPVMAAGLLLIGKFALPAFRAVFKKYDKLNESIEENVRGMRVVKGFAREKHEIEKFGKASDDIKFDFTKAEKIVGLNSPLMEMCLYFNVAFILLLGSKLVVTGKGTIINVGEISALLTYGFMVLMSLLMVSMIYVMLTMSIEAVRRIVEVLDEEPSIKNPENPVMDVKDGSIDFEDVAFRYSEKASRDALFDIDLRIESGMSVGILGGTGSSKTTLIQLIPRLYDVTSGVVKVGGVPVKEYDVKTLRDAVSVVLQKNELFSGTIAENLRWGNENATDEELVEACKIAQAEEFVNSFPDKYDTYIEQGGTNVSGGQKQRLCIARALIKKPKILILDDSTSAVDTKTDALIRKGFAEYIPETTKIIIAQRVASVQDCDMIIIMDGGKIKGVGTHAELLESSDIYREIYEEQTKGGSDNE